jgi:hypothetical protein
MKTTMRFGILLTIALLTFAGSAHAQSKTITSAQLPTTAREFIKKHFASEKIASVWEDRELLGTEYKVRFANGTEVEFDGKGSWDEIDGNHKAIPASVIPAGITAYVKSNYKGQAITKLDKKRSGYEVELANDVELEFDKTGKFVRIDN